MACGQIGDNGKRAQSLVVVEVNQDTETVLIQNQHMVAKIVWETQ